MKYFELIGNPLKWFFALLLASAAVGCGGGNPILGGGGTGGPSDKAITSYSLNGIAGVVSEGTIPKTISVVMPFGTDMSLPLNASFTTTGTRVSVGVPAVTQVSGAAPTNVFTQGTPKIYTVTAANGSSATYNVNVSLATVSAKAIISYSLDGIAGIISEGTTPKTISVVMPFGTDLTLPRIATFLTTGTVVTVGAPAVMQVSGTTSNVFTQGTPKVYTVTAADASTASYNVNVSVATSSAAAITSYSLDGIAGVISEATVPKTIALLMPFGTDLTTAKTATFLTTGTSVTIGLAVQSSGITMNIFPLSPPASKVYVAHAADGITTASYNINVTVAAAPPVVSGPAGAAPILATVAPLGIIAFDAITNSAGPSHIYGDVAMTQAGGTIASVTGSGTNDSGVAPMLLSTMVTDSYSVPASPGLVTAADNGTPAKIAALPQLLLDLRAVYDDLMGRAAPVTALTTIASAANVPGGTFNAATDLSGYVLSPGIYTTPVTYGLSNAFGPLVLDAGGNPDAVFVIRSSGLGISGLTSTTGSVLLQNGAQSKNVYWVVDNATIGGGTFFQGTLVAGHAITLLGFANVEGRMLAGALGLVSGAITLTDTNIITVPQ